MFQFSGKVWGGGSANTIIKTGESYHRREEGESGKREDANKRKKKDKIEAN